MSASQSPASTGKSRVDRRHKRKAYIPSGAAKAGTSPHMVASATLRSPSSPRVPAVQRFETSPNQDLYSFMPSARPLASHAPSQLSQQQEQSLDALADAFLSKLQSRGFSDGVSGVDASTAKNLLTGFASVACAQRSNGPSVGAASEWESDEEALSLPPPGAASLATRRSKTGQADTGASKLPTVARSGMRPPKPARPERHKVPKKSTKSRPVDYNIGDNDTSRQAEPNSRRHAKPTLHDQDRSVLQPARVIPDLHGHILPASPPLGPEQINRWIGETHEKLNHHLDPHSSGPSVEPSWLVLYVVKCPDTRAQAVFFDKPMLVKNDWNSRSGHRWHWDARSRVSPARFRAFRLTAKPFLVVQEYDCSLIRRHGIGIDEDGHDSDHSPNNNVGHVRSRDSSRARKLEDDLPMSEGGSTTSAPSVLDDATKKRALGSLRSKTPSNAQDIRESVYLVSRSLRSKILKLRERHSWLDTYEELKHAKRNQLSAPYYFFYHFQEEMMSYGDELSTSGQNNARDFRLLLRYFVEQTKSAHEEVSDLLAKKKVKAHTMPYLFKPGSILVGMQNGEPLGRAQTSVLSTYRDHTLRGAALEPEQTIRFRVGTSRYSFGGQYRVHDDEITITFNTGDGGAQDINKLSLYPLDFATTKVQDLLVSRGARFHKYCRKHYVTQFDQKFTNDRTADPNHDEDLVDRYQTPRYMIDGEAFRLLHGEDDIEPTDSVKSARVIDAEPDNTAFLCQLPAFVNGFHIVDKTWVSLLVENIRSITWNKKAFEHLAAPADTKKLITALISNKIEPTESMDFVHGKGTGLIVLLHGGPGTGKTLTAESVAELAEKPLYRVSCGDIGTDARQVEDYLKSVFYLGRRWKSVVLLDEADIFLEERSLDNLERNALVSVFLRMIEYFDGILILTSNRVGIFDEAFKSRIQLSLHHQNLNREQRGKIWTSFIARLRELREDMEPDIEKKIGDLAAYEINGRQIRNAITSARQVSRYERNDLTFERLRSVLEVGQRFETYLHTVKGHSSEDWARAEGHR